MATAVLPLAPTPTAFDEPTPAPATPARPDLPDPRQHAALAALLTSTHPTYRAGVADWLTAERRLFGGSPALSELQPFSGETAADYAIRQRKATYVPFPKLQAAAQTGHLMRQLPMPNFGTLGEVRDRSARGTGTPSLAELIYYNCDGIGQDGTQWPAWWAKITEAVHGPGFQWIYVEQPSVADVRARLRSPDGPITAEDVRAGLRPYLVAFPPGQVPNHHTIDGRREWAVVRIPMRAPRFSASGLEGNDGGLGYLLLVRRGWLGFGADFQRGGWWTFDAEMAPLATGDWQKTRGEIPLFLYPYEASEGLRAPAGGADVTIAASRPLGEELALTGALTSVARHAPLTSYPAIARSGTLEVGNVAIALMDAISERDYDAREAAASGLTVAGVDPDVKPGQQNNFNDFAYSKGARSRLSPLPFSVFQNGTDAAGQPTYAAVIPTVTDDSTGAVPADVYEKLIASKFTEAREIMARELTSAPDASGASKAAGFAEGKSPRLALLAANLETAQNTALYFLELRAGAGEPRGYVTLPRDYDLAPVLDTIDAALERLQSSGLDSPTLRAELMLQSLEEEGRMPEDPNKRQAVIDEITASAQRPRTSALETLLGASGRAATAPAEPPPAPVVEPSAT